VKTAGKAPAGRVAPRRSKDKVYTKGEKSGGRRPPPGSPEEARLLARRPKPEGRRSSPDRSGEKPPVKGPRPGGRKPPRGRTSK